MHKIAMICHKLTCTCATTAPVLLYAVTSLPVVKET